MRSPHLSSPGRRRLTPRAAAPALLIAGAILVAVSCGESTEPTTFGDTMPPRVSVVADAPPADTAVGFTVSVLDNLGIRTVHVEVTGGINQVYDTTFTTAVSKTDVPLIFGAARSVPPGTGVRVIATATDGAGNRSLPDTLEMAVGNVTPPNVVITSPTTASVAVVGKSFILSLSARSALKVKIVGFEGTGAMAVADSSIFTSPLSDTVAVKDTVSVPATATPGPLTLTPFVVDSIGNRVLGAPVVLNVQTAAASNSRPVVTFGITPRAEVTDTIFVRGTDGTGITSLGYEVLDSVGQNLIFTDQTTYDGSFTEIEHTFQMRLPITVFPTRTRVRAFATNSNGTREYAQLGGGVERRDTVTIVAGVTRRLPSGGKVADGYYHEGKDRLYLTNIERNQLEVFNFADSSFKRAIHVGSRPWGIAPWPRDRAGTPGDTLLVANSGGTNISYVNLNPVSPFNPNGEEAHRYPLPNIIPYSVKTQKDASTGLLFRVRIRYDFSDRPQFIGATCSGPETSGPCGDVILVYSTTPTRGQSDPFQNKGTIRWENLSKKMSHFFFEQALGMEPGTVDTLEIERYSADTLRGGRDSVLVPFQQMAYDPAGTDSGLFSVLFRPLRLGFRDTTFVRNSGNFRRAIMGEGGSVAGSRAIGYDAFPGMDPTDADIGQPWLLTLPIFDLGITPAIEVNDYVANAYSTVYGVGINFDGEIAAIRADSTYLLNPNLRLQGLLQTSGGNPGLDFHPENTGVNATDLRTRLAFAASAEPQIEIYDTYCYQRVAVVPTREPVIGPIKASIRPTGELMLVGATIHGVVMVSLPDTYATSCPAGPTMMRASRLSRPTASAQRVARPGGVRRPVTRGR
jgi:hypothetical protein